MRICSKAIPVTVKPWKVKAWKEEDAVAALQTEKEPFQLRLMSSVKVKKAFSFELSTIVLTSCFRWDTALRSISLFGSGWGHSAAISAMKM